MIVHVQDFRQIADRSKRIYVEYTSNPKKKKSESYEHVTDLD